MSGRPGRVEEGCCGRWSHFRVGRGHAASDYCRKVIGAAGHLSAYETMYAVSFFDAAGDTAGLEALGRRLPRDGRLAGEGGTDTETLKLLGLSPRPGRAARRLFDERVADEELDQLANEQHPDGGWDFDCQTWLPRWPSNGGPG